VKRHTFNWDGDVNPEFIRHIEMSENARAQQDDGAEFKSLIRDTEHQLRVQRADLLAALEAAVSWAKPMAEAPTGARPKWFDVARAAIAKVKGGAS
jgi:hypothetical protein